MTDATQNMTRTQLIERAIARWTEQLVDVSGRSRLMVHRDLRAGTLDMTPGTDSGIDEKVLQSLLSGRTVKLSRLFHEPDASKDALRRASSIYRHAQENDEEKGIDTLYLALGMATWNAESEDHVTPNAPVVLLPVSIHPEGAGWRDHRLTVSGDPIINPVLAYVLRREHGLQVCSNGLDKAIKTIAGIDAALENFTSEWKDVPGITIDFRAVLGNYYYANMPMVEDLERSAPVIAGNTLLAAIAGDIDARNELASAGKRMDRDQQDIIHPSAEYMVLDADSSQIRVINRAIAGEPVVVCGPPGTGKSQTIANLVASLIGVNRRVLFVSQKRAAIDAVVKRLNAVGLGNLVMDGHGRTKSGREFASQMADAIQSVKKAAYVDYSSLHKESALTRNELNSHIGMLHGRRAPWNISIYGMMDGITAAPEQAKGDFHMPINTAANINANDISKLKEYMKEWTGMEGHRFASQYPEWATVAAYTSEQAIEAYDTVRGLAADLPNAGRQLDAVASQVSAESPSRIVDWGKMVDLFDDVDNSIRKHGNAVYSLDCERISRSLAPANGWTKIFASLMPGYRGAMKAASEAIGKGASKEYILETIEIASRQNSEWNAIGANGKPRNLQGTNVAKGSVDSIRQRMNNLRYGFAFPDMEYMDHRDAQALLERMANQNRAAASLPRLHEIDRIFRDANVSQTVDAIGKDISTEYAADALEYAWHQAIYARVLFDDPSVTAFQSDYHNNRVDGYAALDRASIESNRHRIKRIAAENAFNTMEKYPEEAALVQKEAAKKTRHIPLRRLMEQAPNVMTSLMPCWTMSPLMVSELLPSDMETFDVVIFDEASQIPPAEAIGSLARAKQAVIAGDANQLPPTNVFSRQLASEGDSVCPDGALIDDLESILDVARAMPLHEEMLTWHYRSRDARLISFSNGNIYKNAMLAFPSTEYNSPISHHLVDFRPLGLRTNRSNPDEVEKVVDLVIDHASNSPERSLGVIAFGIQHASNIETALRDRLREMDDRAIDKFFSEESEERFFIKNIERVQGDERDTIILSVGYHKSNDGTLPLRFGTLNQTGGERRLNVAVTRARSNMHVVSSFSHADVSAGRSSSKGVAMLREFLAYASQGGEVISNKPNGRLDAIQQDILKGMMERGIPALPNYGVAGCHVTFACSHPADDNRMVLAIETDGGDYRNVSTARDRDRLRKQVLESMGWQYHRVWTVAWYNNREAELDRIQEVWENAVGIANGYRDAAAGEVAEYDMPNAQERSAKPDIQKGLAIGNYSHEQLVELAGWIRSDGMLRTIEEMAAEMRQELGFIRRGARIDEAMDNAVKAA